MEQKSFFASSRLLLAVTLFLLFGTALAIRVYDLTDLPLDFHPTRQLFSAAKARGMYYETLTNVPEWKREFAIQQWKTKATIEPEIMEHLAAFLYRFAGEQLWIPRLISALFWLIGGIFIYFLARDMVSIDGAVLALAFYLLVPYGIFASRSFQPDPLMVVLTIAFWWLIYRWADLTPNPPPSRRGESWKWAILAGVVGGLAIFVKFVAVFFVIGGALGAMLGRFKLHELVRSPQVWAVGVLGMFPGGAWITYGKLVAGLYSEGMSGRFIPSLLASPLFYVQWQTKAAAVVGGLGIMLGLLGIFIVRNRVARVFLLGIWGAYLVFGLYFNYHVSTHDYYSLPLVQMVALSLAPLGNWFFARLTDAGGGWVRGAVFVILLYGVFSIVWGVRNEMKSVDYRPQVAFWAEIHDVLDGRGSVVALTEDYGNRLEYWGWQRATNWPSYGDLYQADVRGSQRDIEELFQEMTATKTLFLVTDLADFAKQKELQELLAGYPVLVQGDGYVIYDLQPSLEMQP